MYVVSTEKHSQSNILLKKIIQRTPHHPDMRDQSNLSELLIVVELLWNLFTRRHFIGISQCNLQWIPIQIINQIVIQHSLELSAHTYRGDDIRWAENGPCGMQLWRHWSGFNHHHYQNTRHNDLNLSAYPDAQYTYHDDSNIFRELFWSISS